MVIVITADHERAPQEARGRHCRDPVDRRGLLQLRRYISLVILLTQLILSVQHKKLYYNSNHDIVYSIDT